MQISKNDILEDSIKALQEIQIRSRGSLFTNKQSKYTYAQTRIQQLESYKGKRKSIKLYHDPTKQKHSIITTWTLD